MKQILVRPIITEKSLNLVETENQYMFEVDLNTNKIEVGKAVAEKYGVAVLNIRIMKRLGKSKLFGRSRINGKRKDSKIAFVTLKSGDNITEFSVK